MSWVSRQLPRTNVSRQILIFNSVVSTVRTSAWVLREYLLLFDTLVFFLSPKFDLFKFPTQSTISGLLGLIRDTRRLTAKWLKVFCISLSLALSHYHTHSLTLSLSLPTSLPPSPSLPGCWGSVGNTCCCCLCFRKYGRLLLKLTPFSCRPADRRPRARLR